MQKDNYEHVDHEDIIYISDALEYELRKGMAGDDAFLDTVKEQYSAESVRAVRYIVAAVKRAAPEIYALVKELEELEPYLEQELQKPEYDGKNLDELADESQKDERNWPVKGSLYMIALDAARRARDQITFPTLKSEGVPKYYMLPNSTLENALQAIDGKGDVIDEGPLDLPVLNIGTSKEVTVYVDATFENIGSAPVYVNKVPSEYDKVVEAAVASLVEDRTRAGLPPIVTADMVYRTMTHKTKTEKVTAQQRESVDRSMDKMRKYIYIKLDATSELQARKAIGPGQEFVIEDFMLSATKIRARSGGRVVDAYHIKSMLLWDYTKLNRQYYTIKGDLLDVREIRQDSQGRDVITDISIPNNEKRIATKSYLLRRIKIMESDERTAADRLRKYRTRRKKNKDLPEKTLKDFRTHSRTILFDKIFTVADIKNKNTKTDTKKYVLDVLIFLKAKGQIKGYFHRKRKGKLKEAVIITV